MTRKVKALGIMGGTFDPIHYGHLVTAEGARCTFGLSQVLFVPSGRPPHKEGAQVTDAEHRYMMTVLATLTNPYFEVSRTEIDRVGVSYTIDTLRILRQGGPDVSCSSSLAQMPSSISSAGRTAAGAWKWRILLPPPGRAFPSNTCLRQRANGSRGTRSASISCRCQPWPSLPRRSESASEKACPSATLFPNRWNTISAVKGYISRPYPQVRKTVRISLHREGGYDAFR